MYFLPDVNLIFETVSITLIFYNAYDEEKSKDKIFRDCSKFSFFPHFSRVLYQILVSVSFLLLFN